MAYEGVVGQREGLSSLDISKIGRMYGCPVFGEFRIVWEGVGLGAVGCVGQLWEEGGEGVLS